MKLDVFGKKWEIVPQDGEWKVFNLGEGTTLLELITTLIITV